MTQVEFIQNIREAYLNARKCFYQPNNLNVLSRGTSHSISSLTEDLFGCYCAQKVFNTANEIKIYVDPPISFKGTSLKNKSEKKSLLIRPDLAIINNNVVTAFFDIKTDLGYKRKIFYDQAVEKNLQLERVKGKLATFNDGETKEKNYVTISENIKFIYIVISQGNIKKTVQESLITEIRELNNIEAFLLTEGNHLNSYHHDPVWRIKKDDFDGLDILLNEYLK